MVDHYARKVFWYLLKPRSKSYFLPDIVQLLQQGDGNAQRFVNNIFFTYILGKNVDQTHYFCNCKLFVSSLFLVLSEFKRIS